MIQYHNDILTIQAAALIDLGVVSEQNYKNLKKRSQLSVIRRGGNGNPALVSYESIPERFQTKIIAMIGDPYKRAKKATLMDQIVMDDKANTFFSTFITKDHKELPSNVQREYRFNAAVLNAVNVRYNALLAKRKSLGGSTRGCWQTVVKEVNELHADVYPCKLPSNERRLKSVLNMYLQDGYQSLVHKGYGNSNSRKVTVKIESLILSLYCQPEKPYQITVAEQYRDFICGEIDEVVDVRTGELIDRSDFIVDGEPIELCERTIEKYLTKPKNQVIVQKLRASDDEYRNIFEPHANRHKPKYSFSKVSMDDRDLPRKMHDGKRMKVYYYTKYFLVL